MSFGYWVAAAVLVFRSIVLSGLVAKQIIDLKFYTYQNYTAVAAGFALLLLSMRRSEWFKAYALFALPLFYGTTIYVAVAIVVIINLNDFVLMRGSVHNGGALTDGDLHTGDFLLHQLPLVEVLFVILVNFSWLKAAIRSEYALWSKANRVLYILYFLTISSFSISFYMSIYPFDENYPTPLATWELTLLSIAVAIGTEALLLLALLTGDWDRRKEETTPITKWTGR